MKGISLTCNKNGGRSSNIFVNNKKKSEIYLRMCRVQKFSFFGEFSKLGLDLKLALDKLILVRVLRLCVLFGELPVTLLALVSLLLELDWCS